MATKTVHTLNYKLQVKADDFPKDLKATNKELGFAKRQMMSLKSPADRMEEDLRKLGDLAEKDARFQGLYNKKLKAFQAELDKSGRKMNKHGQIVTKWTTKWKMAGASISGALLDIRTLGAVLVGGAIVRGIKTQADTLDELGKKARSLGVDVEWLSALQFRAGQDIGLAYEQTTDAIDKMTIQVGRGTVEMGRARTVLEKYNIDLADFKGMRPQELFYALSDAFKNVNNEQDQIVIGSALFGDKLARMFQLMQNINNVDLKPVVSREQVQNAEDLIDTMGETANLWRQMSLKIGDIIGPTLNRVLGEINAILDRLEPEGAEPGKPTPFLQLGDIPVGTIRLFDNLLSGRTGISPAGPFGDVASERFQQQMLEWNMKQVEAGEKQFEAQLELNRNLMGGNQLN